MAGVSPPLTAEDIAWLKDYAAQARSTYGEEFVAAETTIECAVPVRSRLRTLRNYRPSLSKYFTISSGSLSL